jgi:hypothetical protein
MDANPRIRRLTLVPFEGTGGDLRRYRLARMDEIALATPPDPAAVRRDGGAGNGAGPDDKPSEKAPPAVRPDRA